MAVFGRPFFYERVAVRSDIKSPSVILILAPEKHHLRGSGAILINELLTAYQFPSNLGHLIKVVL
jgi:hypothetical protein